MLEHVAFTISAETLTQVYCHCSIAGERVQLKLCKIKTSILLYTEFSSPTLIKHTLIDKILYKAGTLQFLNLSFETLRTIEGPLYVIYFDSYSA